MMEEGPVGYRVQKYIPCCANCVFGGYLGLNSDPYRMCICEIMGKCSDSDYGSLAKEPLGICDAYKAHSNIKFNNIVENEN